MILKWTLISFNLICEVNRPGMNCDAFGAMSSYYMFSTYNFVTMMVNYTKYLIRSSSLTRAIAYLSPRIDRASKSADTVLLLLPLSNGTSCPGLSDHKIRWVVSAVYFKHTPSGWHIRLLSPSLAGHCYDDDLFGLLDFPFLNTSALEDAFRNSALYKCFYYY